MRWFEVLSLGLDVLTWSEINRTRNHVRSLEESKMAQMVQEEVYKVLRNIVFASLKSAEAMQDFIESEPLKVYVGSKLLKWRLDDIGIKTELFSQFEDKEWVHKTLGTIKNLIDTSSRRLSGDQTRDGEECIQIILEMPELNEAIDTELKNEEIRKKRIQAEKILEELHRIDEEYEPLKKARDRRQFTGFLVAGIGSFVVCVGGYCMSMGVLSSSNNQVINLSVFMFTILSGIVLVGGLIYAFRSSKKFSEIANKRSTLQMSYGITPPLQSLPEKYKNLSLGELLELRETRQNFIQSILGDSDTDYNYEMIFLQE